MSTGNLLIAVLVRNDPRGTIADALAEFAGDGAELERLHLAMASSASYTSLGEVATALEAHFRDTPHPLAIVLSDALLESGHYHVAARDLVAAYTCRPVVTIALSPDGQRAPDVDRVVRCDADRRAVVTALRFGAERLWYMTRPPHDPASRVFKVRRIHDEFELAQYYQLRHQVYDIMGYLTDAKSRVPSRREIDGCDVNAIHLGAFEQGDGYENLVGTARLLLLDAEETQWAAWTRRLLDGDPSLRALVTHEKLSLGLPVFQSQPLNEHLQASFKCGIMCAEVSRVIVRPTFRGNGLAQRLVDSAIAEARAAGVDRLYLECLKLHESMYGQFGFRTIPGIEGRVIGVSKTMIAMMMELTAHRTNASAQPATTATSVTGGTSV